LIGGTGVSVMLRRYHHHQQLQSASQVRTNTRVLHLY